MPPLGLVVFVVGIATLGTEIAAARLLAPFFGASTIIWANTIAVVLVSLSVGYWYGGRYADRAPSMQRLLRLVLLGALLLAAAPFVANPFLETAVGALDRIRAGAFAGSLLAVLVLIAVPMLVLGMVAPYAIRLAVARVDEAGRVAGRLYAISTVGSLLGTFLSALLLIPLAGTRRTFLVFALALAVTAAAGLRRRWLLVPLALVLLVALPVGTVKATENGDLVLREADTPYQYARVVQDAGTGDRYLELNEGQAVHSLRRRGSYLTGGIWDEFLVAPFAALQRPPRRIAILGNAAGTIARAYGRYFPQTAVDGVEIDGELTEMGRRYFDLRNPRMTVYTEDARPFLRRTERRYDAIFVDAYRQPYIPFYLTTREFFRLARGRLTPGGVLVVNVGHPPGSTAVQRVLAATLADVFPTVLADPAEEMNTLLLATDGPASADRLRRAVPKLPADLRPRAGQAADRIGVPLRGGRVFTDDRAPVEWLIDASIVRFAAGELER